jgi:hypothetical protein
MIQKELPDVPDWIDDKIEFDEQKDFQDHHLVYAFVESEKPFLTVSQLATKFDKSKEGIRNRVHDLEVVDVLDSCPGAGGRLYWIHDDRSNWPIPPDVQIEPIETTDETTVSELTQRSSVQYGGAAVAAAMFGSVLITGLVAGLIFEIQIPSDLGGIVMVIAVMAAVFSFVFGLIGIGHWLYYEE